MAARRPAPYSTYMRMCIQICAICRNPCKACSIFEGKTNALLNCRRLMACDNAQFWSHTVTTSYPGYLKQLKQIKRCFSRLRQHQTSCFNCFKRLTNWNSGRNFYNYERGRVVDFSVLRGQWQPLLRYSSSTVLQKPVFEANVVSDFGSICPEH